MNSHETTGKQGKGKLWFEGANYASDMLVLLEREGQRHMLAIRRKSGHWAMPGGFRDRRKNHYMNPVTGEMLPDLIEDPRAAAFRELVEETGFKVSLPMIPSAQLMYEGYVKDERNTDDAWIETSMFVVDLGQVDEFPPVTAADDAQAVCWLKMTPENVRALYPGHAEIVQKVLDSGELSVCLNCEHRMLSMLAIDSDNHASILTQLLNTTINHGLDAEHVHPNPYVRVQMVLTIVAEVVQLIRSRLQARLTPEEQKLAVEHALAFDKVHTSAEVEQQVDEGLNAAPAVAKMRRDQRSRRPVMLFPIDPNAEKN